MKNYHFVYHPDRRNQFMSGELVKQWKEQYPFLFDDDDVRLTKTQPESHFFEWLTAVLIYEATGYYSMIENYIADKHRSKKQKFRTLVGETIFEFADTHQAGLPDLFCYSSTSEEWFFCEVKGNNDRIRGNQSERFEELLKLTDKNVRIATLKPLKLNL